mmetsp:Transcript_27703/g.50178  ORF Transcript_27703/g.50178 Transcript_27703/m.50178 type:complete len:215 (-) Transcript_27703:4783-5427(-)
MLGSKNSMTLVECSATIWHLISVPSAKISALVEPMASTSTNPFLLCLSKSRSSSSTNAHSRMCGFSGSSKPKHATFRFRNIHTNSSIRSRPKKWRTIGPTSEPHSKTGFRHSSRESDVEISSPAHGSIGSKEPAACFRSSVSSCSGCRHKIVREVRFRSRYSGFDFSLVDQITITTAQSCSLVARRTSACTTIGCAERERSSGSRIDVIPTLSS